MESKKSIGRVKFKARYILNNENVDGVVDFDDRGTEIYYCWNVTDNSGQQIASKCLPIAKRVISSNPLEYCLNQAKSGIENFRADRQRLFEITEWNVV